jgi:CRISPR-associated protein Csd2
MSTIENRYDFVFYFDCQDGNPNGDPDSDNSPRFDPETLQGLVTDVCLKRKIRDYVFQSQQDNGSVRKGYDIFVLAGGTLESRQRMPYDNWKSEITPAGGKTTPADIARARGWMCERFFDVRAFGAVMSTTEFNCGQVRGPVQITFARSVDRIFSTEHTIYRQAFTGEKDIKAGTGTFGKKHTVAYGLYRAQGFINPAFARQTGFHEDDLTLLWAALGNMFDLDRSAARGFMSTRELFVFKHRSALGNAPAHRLFELVTARKRDGVEAPRSYLDYAITEPNPSQLPDGVDLLQPLQA